MFVCKINEKIVDCCKFVAQPGHAVTFQARSHTLTEAPAVRNERRAKERPNFVLERVKRRRGLEHFVAARHNVLKIAADQMVRRYGVRVARDE